MRDHSHPLEVEGRGKPCPTMSSWLVVGGGETQLDDDVKGVALRLEYPRVPWCMRRVSLPPPRLHCRSVVVPVLSGEVARVYCPRSTSINPVPPVDKVLCLRQRKLGCG